MRSPDKIQRHASQCLQVTLLLIASTAGAQTTPTPPANVTPPIQCTPPWELNTVTNKCVCKSPPNVLASDGTCYRPLPPEWTPYIDFYTQSMPQGGGSVPDPHYIPPPKPGEIFITSPMVWDLYQSQAASNPNFAYYPVRGGMRPGDTFTVHFSNGLCFILIRHQTPLPDQTVLHSVAMGDTSGTGATSSNGTAAVCAIPQAESTPGHVVGSAMVRIW